MKKSNSNILEFTTKFINSNFRIKWFGFSEIKEADKLAAQLNERDGLKEIYD